MTSINNALYSIINRKDGFCCLCLSSIKDEPIRLDDEVVMNLDNYDYDTTIAEVLKLIYDEEMYNYICTFNTLCDQCSQSAISCYKFVQLSQKNAKYLTNVINGIADNFEYTTTEYDSKSLYVSLNLEDFTSKQYYDIVKRTVNTPQAVLRRFHTLDSQKIKIEDGCVKEIKKEEDGSNVKVKKRKPRNFINIPTKEMLFDKNNPNLFKCKECYKIYPTIWNLRNHFIRMHAPKVFKCPECPRKYGSVAFLDAHKFQSHCTVVCSECGKTFYNRHTLKMHELGHHVSIVCQDCGRVYKNKATFNKHIELNVCGKETRAHPSEAKFTCDYCNKRYTQKVSLRVHIQYEHGNYKAHVCEWCGKKFWAQSRLKAHIVKHTRDKKFICPTCGGKFVSKESLLYHTRIHTGEKPYKCPHCENCFLSASRRSDHVKRHHEGATLECDICHSKFNSNTFLMKHKRLHTIKKPEDKSNVLLKKSKIICGNKSDNLMTLEVSESNSKDLWQLTKIEEDDIPCYEKIIHASEVDLNQLAHQVYGDNDEHQSSEDRKVYLEVSDDTDDFIKILGV